MKKAIIAAVVLASSFATADTIQPPTGWYVNLGAGQERLDDDRNLDDDASAIFGAEYRYNDNFSTELVYSVGTFDGDNEDGVQGPDAKVKRYHLDGFYHFADSRNFKPYVVAGLGHGDFSYSNAGTNGESEVNAGVGARYWLTENWSARLDGRVFKGLDSETTDSVLSLGISYAFGSAPVAAPVAAAATCDANADDDKDGANNCVDECPNTPAGQRVDAMGCKGKVANDETVTLNVEFDFDKATIRSADDAQLSNIATVLKNHEEISGVEVKGYTDSVGSDAYNLKLSDSRANSVVGRMTENGVAANRLTAKGYGEAAPVASNATAEGRQQNRRVNAVFVVPAQ
jgi:OOP family OmpA-OmpF porin